MTDERIWLATGRMSLGGPAVAFTEQAAEEWRNMGWKVQGPYVLEECVDQLQRRIDAVLVLVDGAHIWDGDTVEMIRVALRGKEREVTSDV